MSQPVDVAIVGVGTTDFGSIYSDKDPFRTEYQLGVDALKLARDDAGLDKSEIDGMLLSRMPSYETFGYPVCLREDTVRWIDASGRGTAWSWIRIHQPYMPAFKDEIPYTVAYIKLEEGPLLMSTLQGVADEDIVCDMPVDVVFAPYGEDAIPMPEFRAVAS